MAIESVAAPLTSSLQNVAQTPPSSQVRADFSQSATEIAAEPSQPTNNAGNQAAAASEAKGDNGAESSGGESEGRGDNLDIYA